MQAGVQNGSDGEWLNYLRKGIEKLNVTGEPSKSTRKKSPSRPNSPPQASKKPPFEPKERPLSRIPFPDDQWLAILECPCTFSPEIFNTVMLNLVKNPNVTSSHLFRADIFYDSTNDRLFDPRHPQSPYQGLSKHLKAEYQPRPAAHWPGFQSTRTIVRQLVPRNPQLDKPLVQTCHFFESEVSDGSGEEERTLILYIPHVEEPSEMPFYHPSVSQLAFLHSWQASPQHETLNDAQTSPGFLTLLYLPFTSQQVSTKLERTALKLLQTIHKHGQGQLFGYKKRVHLDQIIPQKRYQDTYTRLKTTYGKKISEQWVEVTDPGKHVFEDLGIAAFLIELWRDMYRLPNEQAHGGKLPDEQTKPPFPGFVDIGCGNGLLVFLLLSEGYPGFGFDARQRKTWTIFPEPIRFHLERRILVPSIFEAAAAASTDERWHNGVFTPGTFIVSNHADELTPWTPLLAYLNDSSFIAVPCCSHDLAGARFRAPSTTKAEKEASISRLPQQQQKHEGTNKGDAQGCDLRKAQAAETGSLKRTEAQKKMPSAYSTLCSYVSSLAGEVGFEPETDTLRIPSTRNSCILGRKRRRGNLAEGEFDKKGLIIGLIERELKRDISSVGAEWIEQARKLMKKPSSGH